MAATATMMPNLGQNISSPNDLVPEWTREEVSTGVSTGEVWIRTGQEPTPSL